MYTINETFRITINKFLINLFSKSYNRDIHSPIGKAKFSIHIFESGLGK